MPVSDLPIPGTTPPNWGAQLNDGIESRYEENSERIDDLSAEVDELDLTYYDKLLPWYADLANRANQKVNVVCLGDSTFEGYRLTDIEDTLPVQLGARLRTMFPVASTGLVAGRGLVGAQNDMTNLSFWPQVLAGGASVLTPFGTVGRYVDLTTTGKTVTYTVQAGGITSFDIHVIKGAYGSATGGYYKIDGGASVTFATNDAAPVLASILHVASPVTSTIEIGWNAGGGALVSGIVEYQDDATTGVSVHNFGYSGTQVSDWSAISGSGGPLDWALLMDPALIIIELGTNDARVGGGNLPASTFQTNLTNYITTIRSKGGSLAVVPIVLSMIYDPATGAAGAGLNQPWVNYVDAAKAIAAADDTVICVDHSARMPANYLTDTYALYNGSFPPHAAAKGYALMAETLAKVLSPR